MPREAGDQLLTPGEVAARFRVDPKTVTRWAAAGRLPSIRTPGGHRRFRPADVQRLLDEESTGSTGARIFAAALDGDLVGAELATVGLDEGSRRKVNAAAHAVARLTKRPGQ